MSVLVAVLMRAGSATARPSTRIPRADRCTFPAQLGSSPEPGSTRLFARATQSPRYWDRQGIPAGRSAGAPHRGTARAELALRRNGGEELAAMRAELERLRAQRSSLAVRRIERLGDVEARIAELERKRERVALALGDLPQPVTQRRARCRDDHAVERVRLCTTLSAYDHALASARAERARLQRELGDREQVRSERDGLDRAIRELQDRTDELQRNLPERGRSRQARQRTREVARPPVHDIDLGY